MNHSQPLLATNASTSESLQRVHPGPSRTGCGSRPSRAQRHIVFRDTRKRSARSRSRSYRSVMSIFPAMLFSALFEFTRTSYGIT